MATAKITTPLTEVLGIEKPIMLAGMNVAAGPELAAAVTNHGGIGTIGGVGSTVTHMRKQIQELKSHLKDKNAPFGVDLLLPSLTSGRKTNYDYTKGTLPELIDLIIEEKAKLFVCAVGVPPKWVVDKLHGAGIVVANMVGAPKHALKAIELGCDIVIAQGGEGGGHTGDIPTSVLLPKTADIIRGKKSAFTGREIILVGAGGIFDGRGLASALSLGASGVWVGTRFVASTQAGAPPRHQQAVVKAGLSDTIRTIIYTGRPMRVLKTDYIMNWENNRASEITKLTSQGILPVQHELDEKRKSGEEVNFQDMLNITPLLMGKCAGAIDSILPAEEIMDEMINTAAEVITKNRALVSKL